MAKLELLFGISPIEGALIANRRKLVRLIVKEGSKNPRHKDLLKLAKKAGVAVEEADGNRLQKLAKGNHHQGVLLECGPLPEYEIEDLLEDPPKLIVALDQIEDPMNLGAICRSAAFLGAGGILHLRHKACPLSATASKASAGAMERLPIVLVNNLAESLERLKKEQYWVYGADAGAHSLPFTEIPKPERCVLVMGNEGAGLRLLTQKRCDSLIHIPGVEGTESLNVSNAAAILIHHYAS